MTISAPPQRRFDGRAMTWAYMERFPNAKFWAERSRANAQDVVDIMGDDRFQTLMARYSDQWFEDRTWRDQAAAYGRLLDILSVDPDAPLAQQIAAFGPPDSTPREQWLDEPDNTRTDPRTPEEQWLDEEADADRQYRADMRADLR